MRLRTYHASCLDYHTGSLMCMSTYKHTHTQLQNTHTNTDTHTHTKQKNTHTNTNTHTQTQTHTQTDTDSLFLSPLARPAHRVTLFFHSARRVEQVSPPTLPHTGNYEQSDTSGEKGPAPPPPPHSLSLSLCLSFFLSAGHRGRRNDPQALGPPDHSLCY